MHSFAQMNGHHQQVGPPSQAFQAAAPLAQNATGNYTWSSEDAFNYIAEKSGVQQSERGHVTSHNGAYANRQMANWQNSAAPNQTVHCQNVARPEKDHYLRMLLRHLEPKMKSQNENASLAANKRLASKLDIFYQTSVNQAQNDTINTNTTYPQQNMSSCWNPSAAVNRLQTTDMQAGQVASHHQPNGVQQGLYPNANGGLTSGVSAYTTAAASLQNGHVVNPNMLVSAAAHNRRAVQVAHNQVPRQSETERRFSQSYTVSHGMTTCQSGLNSMAAQPQASNTQTLFASNMSQQTQQHTTTARLPLNNWSNTNSNNTNLFNQSVVNYVGATNHPHPNVAPQQMSRPRDTTDSQCMSYTARFAVRGRPPPYSMYRHANTPRSSNQHVQTVTSVSSPRGFNTSVSQPLPLHSRESFPQNGVYRPQNTVGAQAVQTSSSDASSATIAENATGSGRGETAWAHLPNNNVVSRGNPVGLPNNAPQQMNSPGGASTQTLNISYLAKHPELVKILGLPNSEVQDDSSTHSTPSHTGTRVVAVVQPLSPQNAVTSPNTTTCDSESIPEKDCMSPISPNTAKNSEEVCMEEQSNLHTNSQTQTSSTDAKSSDGAALKSSESEPHDSTRISKPDSEAATSAQNASDVTPSQSCQNKQSEMATPPSPTVPDLSSVPALFWTAKALRQLIVNTEEVEKKDASKQGGSFTSRFAAMFCKTEIVAMLCYFNSGKQKHFLSNVEKFCEMFILQDTVVLSQVKQDQLKHYHVLKEGEVYSELPYKSLWLNVNDQLDDIDKEFGLPWVFKHRQNVLDTDSQVDQVTRANTDPKPILHEVPSAVLAESESTDVMEEDQAPPVETPSTPLASPSKSEWDDSYSFKIHVLEPEEAKVLYEQVKKNTSQVIDFQELRDTVVNKPPKEVETQKIDAALKESAGLIRSTCDQIDQICCLAKLMEMKTGLSAGTFECQCKDDQSHPENLTKTPIPVADSPGKSESNSCHIISLSSRGLSSELCQIIDLTDDDNDKLLSSSDPEPEMISEVSSGIQSDVGGSDEDNLSTRDPVLQNETPDAVEMTESLDEDKDLKLAESMPPSTSLINVTETECAELSSTENEVGTQMSDQKGDDGEEHIQPAEEAESSPQSEEETQTDGKAIEQTPSSPHPKHGTPVTVRQKQSSLYHYFPSLTESKKCKIPFDMNLQNVSNVQYSASEGKTVELVLFGSMKHNDDNSLYCSSAKFSFENNTPPPVLSVKLNPLRRNSVEAPSTREYSVKELIYEKWRKSFPTTRVSITRGRKQKWKIKRSLSAPLSSMSLKRIKSSDPSDGNDKCCLRLKRRSLSDGISPKEAKKRRYSIVPYQPDDQKRSNTENKSQDAMPLQGNVVLKFNVLPSTFSLLDGSTQRNETADPPSEKPELVEEKDRTSNKAVKQKVEQWHPSLQKRYRPLCAPRNAGLFNEYQKKYQDKKEQSPRTES